MNDAQDIKFEPVSREINDWFSLFPENKKEDGPIASFDRMTMPAIDDSDDDYDELYHYPIDDHYFFYNENEEEADEALDNANHGRSHR